MGLTYILIQFLIKIILVYLFDVQYQTAVIALLFPCVDILFIVATFRFYRSKKNKIVFVIGVLLELVFVYFLIECMGLIKDDIIGAMVFWMIFGVWQSLKLGFMTTKMIGFASLKLTSKFFIVIAFSLLFYIVHCFLFVIFI